MRLTKLRAGWVVLGALAWSVPAWGHAFLDHADPKVGAEVTGSPREVSIWFTEGIEPAFSSIKVFDAKGAQVDKKDFHLEAKDNTHGLVSLPPNLPTGKYKVVWAVVSTDTHKTQGDFTFTIRAAGRGPAGGAASRASAVSTRPAVP